MSLFHGFYPGLFAILSRKIALGHRPPYDSGIICKTPGWRRFVAVHSVSKLPVPTNNSALLHCQVLASLAQPSTTEPGPPISQGPLGLRKLALPLQLVVAIRPIEPTRCTSTPSAGPFPSRTVIPEPAARHGTAHRPQRHAPVSARDWPLSRADRLAGVLARVPAPWRQAGVVPRVAGCGGVADRVAALVRACRADLRSGTWRPSPPPQTSPRP